METLPGKKPLIKLTYRPPNYETPIEYFRTPITPNDAFFVRYHLSDIPEVDAKTWKIAVGGDGANGTGRAHARRSEGDAGGRGRRGQSMLGQPARPVPAACAGVEWGYGAMGCARWKGARLKDILDKVGLKKEAIEIVVQRRRRAAVDKTPDFIKSIPVVEGDGGDDASSPTR